MAVEAFKIEGMRDNKLLGRKELKIRIDHFGKGTPTRAEVREKVAKMLNASIDQVYVRKIETEYGMNVSWATVHVYDDPKRALEIEPEYIIKRHQKEEAKEGE